MTPSRRLPETLPGVTDAEEAALLRHVLADPLDLDRRLVYADWLDDHGHPERARLLRCCVAPDRYGLPTPADERFNRDFWSARLFVNLGGGWAFDGGLPLLLVTCFTVDSWFGVEDFMKPHELDWFTGLLWLGESLPLRTPSSERVWLTRSSRRSGREPLDADTLAWLADCEWLDNFVTLDFRFAVPDRDGLRTLLHSPHLSQLRVLYLHPDDRTAAVVEQARARFGDRVRV